MKRLVLLLAFAVSPALAQSAPPPPPVEQVLREELGTKYGEYLAARAQLIEAQRQLATAQQRIRELEAAPKAESSTPPK